MKFRRIISAALLICVLLSFSACKSGSSKAKEVTENLMTALKTYDLAVISGCVEDIPDNTDTSTVIDIYSSDYYRDIYAAANANVTYAITSASGNEIVLKVQAPDLPALYTKWRNSVLNGAMTNNDVKDAVLNGSNSIDPNLIIPAKMLADLKNGSVSTVEREIKLSVIKINGEYKIKNDDQLKLLLSDGLSELPVYASPETESENTEETTENE